MWSLTRSSVPSLVASGLALVVLAVIRLVRRETVRFIGYSALVLAIAAFFALRTGRAQDAFLPGMIGTAVMGLVFLVTNLVRWPVFGFLIAAGGPELAETSQRLKDASRKDAPQDEQAQARAAADEAALKEIFTGWRRHSGIVTVASRLGWVIVGLDVVRLAVMVPLYLAGEVGALGVAKIVLGTPAYLVAVLVMGLVVLRGRTRSTRRAPPPSVRTARHRCPTAADAPGGQSGAVRGAVRGEVSRRRAAGEADRGAEHLLELVLGVRRRDEEQLVVGLDGVVAARGDRAVVADDPDEDGVGRPRHLAERAGDVGAADGDGQLDHRRARLLELEDPHEVADAHRLLDEGGHEPRRRDGDVDAPRLVEHPLVLRVVDRATVRGTPNSVLLSSETTRLALSSPVAATTTSHSWTRASSRTLISQASASSHAASGTREACTSSASGR